MTARLRQLAERFDALSLRERVLVALAAVVVIYMLWDALLMSPEHTRQQQLVARMYQLNEKMAEVDARLQGLSDRLGASEAGRQRQRIAELRQALRGLADQEAALTVEFIRPEQMAGVLRDMLEAEKKLTLLSLESLGARPLFPPPEDGEAAEPGAEREDDYQRPRIYRHAVRITFEGDYFTTLRYLRALEAMPWRFYWDELDYTVTDYPRARIALTIHTLGLEEGWIGV